MEVTVERKGPCEAHVSFTVPQDEFEARVQQGLRHAARNVRMKGFRPGKVPAHLLEKQFGETVRQDVVQSFLNEAYKEAIEENELKPAAHPRIELSDIERAESGELAHEFDISLKPDFELGQYKGMEIDGEPTEVEDEDIEKTLDDLRRQRATPEPAGEDGLEEEGMALCKVSLLCEDEELDSKEGLRLSPKTPVTGVDPDAFEEALTGVKDGETVELPYPIPEGHPREELVGKEGVCRIEVGQVFRVVLATDEELFKLFGVEDAEALDVRMREKIGKVKREREESRIESALLEELIANHPMELPPSMVEEQVASRVEQMKGQLEEQGLSEEEVAQQLEGQDEAAYEASARSMRALFLVESIAKEEELEVGDQDIIDELHDIARRNESSFDEVRHYYQEQGLFQQLAIELLERKVRRFLRENAEVRPAG